MLPLASLTDFFLDPIVNTGTDFIGGGVAVRDLSPASSGGDA